MEGFRVVSAQGDDKEGANVLSVISWVEVDALEYEPPCVAKTPGGGRLLINTQGGRPDADTKENPVLETV